MSEKRDAVSADELLLANTLQLDALIELLMRKGVFTQAEIYEAMKVLQMRRSGGPTQGSA